MGLDFAGTFNFRGVELRGSDACLVVSFNINMKSNNKCIICGMVSLGIIVSSEVSAHLCHECGHASTPHIVEEVIASEGHYAVNATGGTTFLVVGGSVQGPSSQNRVPRLGV